ncbi:aminoacyl-tRNA deacylase [Williamsia sp. CHRR-6]|uniref:aminoacyl-tRNA deacylase n=1 Tax=Williamsia sp. CHRR-6 TaxID=2835871 RepID=UPI001BDB567C|nr:aminoacyl-tRNA deacylase [Williamsia sp. CHRR-6]MBT0565670.1 aminoacyl-tRNA deacylase [Williamsia sp. CHRR-6]
MAATAAIRALQKAGVEFTEHRYRSTGSDFGDEAVEVLVERLSIAPTRVLKTLVIAVDPRPGVRAEFAVAVLPVDQRLSVKAAAAALHASRAQMADPAAVTRSTGYVLGGVSPLGQKTTWPTLIDSSALDWPTVFCSGGRRGLEIELAPGDLIRLTAAVAASITA